MCVCRAVEIYESDGLGKSQAYEGNERSITNLTDNVEAEVSGENSSLSRCVNDLNSVNVASHFNTDSDKSLTIQPHTLQYNNYPGVGEKFVKVIVYKLIHQLITLGIVN